ncbi:MAG: HAD family hydrolase [Candidatus Binataceae bacterium]
MGGINRKRPEGIVFDLGQTIVDDLTFDVRRGYERIEAYLVGERGSRDLYALSLEQLEDLNRRKASLLEVPFVSFIRILASRHGLAFRGTWGEIEREFLKAANPIGAVEGARSVLEVFREEGIPLGIISNSVFSGSALSAQLAELGLREFFGFLISSADFGLRKPHRYFFEAAARQMRLPTRNVWYLGDRIDTDIVGAREAGMVAVWFERGGSPTLDVGGADAKVHSWGEFRSLVEAKC